MARQYPWPPPCPPPPPPSPDYSIEVESTSYSEALPRSDAIETHCGVITPESNYYHTDVVVYQCKRDKYICMLMFFMFRFDLGSSKSAGARSIEIRRCLQPSTSLLACQLNG